MSGSGEPAPLEVIDGLFRRGANGLSLLGSRCLSCGTSFFPQQVGCANPDCVEPQLAPVELPHEGVLYSFTWQSYRPPPLFELEPWEPYAIGLVELEPGLRVMGRLEIPREELAIGMAVKLAGHVMKKSEHGQVEGYVFRAGETR